MTSKLDMNPQFCPSGVDGHIFLIQRIRTNPSAVRYTNENGCQGKAWAYELERILSISIR